MSAPPRRRSRADDPRLRFRAWVDGQLVDEAWLDTGNSDALGHIDVIMEQHALLVELADQAGLRWLVEMYDPAKPEDEAYTRLGTDAAGMVDPRPLS